MCTLLPLQTASAQILPETKTDTLVIRFPDSASVEARENAILKMGGRLTGWIEPLHIARVEVPQAMRYESGSVAAATLNSVLPEFIEYDMPIAGGYAPNDPDFYDASKTYALPTIRMEAAWDVTHGSSDAVIAIIDTGINADHPEFAGRIVAGYDFVHDDSDPDDDHGHGTHVAGIVAAAMDNAQGTAGVCPGCSLMPIKVLNEYNSGTWFNAAQGIVYAVDHGARIINMSLGATTESDTIATAIEYAVSQNVLIVAAAGNEGSHEAFYPAAYAGVFAVSASDTEDALWSLSNFGSYIDVAAPGHLIYSTDQQLDNAYAGYSFKSGTSMAAPHVAGLAGLLLSQNPQQTPDDIIRLITENALDLGAAGWDEQFGYGRIDAGAGLAAARAETNTGTSRTDEVPQEDGHSIFVPIAARE